MTDTPSSHRRRVVIVGGGYVGAPLARALDSDFEVTLIDRLPVFFHRIASLRAAVDPASTDLPFLSRDKLLDRGRVVTGEVVAIHPDEHVLELADGTTLEYDVAIIATGHRNHSIAQFAGTAVNDAKEHFAQLQSSIAAASAVAVIGAGFTGVELVGEIVDAHPTKAVALLSRGSLLPDLPEKAARRVAAQLEERGVLIVTDRPVDANDLDTALRSVKLDPASTLVLWATGGRAEVDWLAVADPSWIGDAGIVVDEYLRIGGRDDLFAVGDVAATDGPKGAMVARRQIPVIRANISPGAPRRQYKGTGPRIALVPVGRSAGVVSIGIGKAEIVLGPRAASTAKGRELLTPMMRKALGM